MLEQYQGITYYLRGIVCGVELETHLGNGILEDIGYRIERFAHIGRQLHVIILLKGYINMYYKPVIRVIDPVSVLTIFEIQSKDEVLKYSTLSLRFVTGCG